MRFAFFQTPLEFPNALIVRQIALFSAIACLGCSSLPACDGENCQVVDGVCVLTENGNLGPGFRASMQVMSGFERTRDSGLLAFLDCGDGLHDVYVSSDGVGEFGADGYPNPSVGDPSNARPATIIQAFRHGERRSIGSIDFFFHPGTCPYAWQGSTEGDACVDTAATWLRARWAECRPGRAEPCACVEDQVSGIVPEECT